MAISKIGEANVSGKFYFTRTWPLGHRYDKVKLQLFMETPATKKENNKTMDSYWIVDKKLLTKGGYITRGESFRIRNF